MLRFLKNIFGNKTSENTEDYEVELSKKSIFSLDTTSIGTSFYIHANPKDVNKEHTMPSYIESADNINTNQVEIIDEKTGRKMMVDAATAQRQMEQIPAGINIPGIGIIGGNAQQRPQNQQAPQHHQQQARQAPQSQARQQMPQGVYLNEDIPQQAPAPQRPIPAQNQQPAIPETFYPATEMASVEGAYHIWIDLAGVSKENIKISYTNSILTVSGSRISNLDLLDLEGDGNRRTHGNKILQESSTVPHFLLGDFSFSYPFKKLVDEAAIPPVSFENGVLHIVLPHRVKSEEVVIPIM